MKRSTHVTHELPDSVLSLSEEMDFTWLSGRRQEASKLRRRVFGLIRRHLARDPKNVRLWCLLGDTYGQTAKRVDCYRRALQSDPGDPEANAELAELYATTGDTRWAQHFDRALATCRGFDVEESVIYAAKEAAAIAGDAKRERRARTLGARRFPHCSLFEGS